LAYACLVKSQKVMLSIPGAAVPDSLIAAQKKLEKQLGAAAAAVRRNPEPAVTEALGLRL